MNKEQKLGLEKYSAPSAWVLILETEACFAASPSLEDIGDEKDEIDW